MKTGRAERLPRREKKPQRPSRYGTVFWLEDSKGHIFLRKRPEKGLLGGMTEVPSSQWRAKKGGGPAILQEAPVPGLKWQPLKGSVVLHVFSHFNLELEIMRGQIKSREAVKGGFWVAPAKIKDQAFPSLMQKVVKLVKSGHRGYDKA